MSGLSFLRTSVSIFILLPLSLPAANRLLPGKVTKWDTSSLT